MSAIHDLIGQIGDPRLRERLAAEVRESASPFSPGLQVAHLYRVYLVNFLINRGETK